MADLGKVRLVCRESRLEHLPAAAVAYLAANRDVIARLLDCVYVDHDHSQRLALLAEHRELDHSAASDEFRGIAEEALRKASDSSPLFDRGPRVTDDAFHMLMRVLAYAKYVSCECPGHELHLSPIDHFGLVRASGNFLSVSEAEWRAIPWHLGDMVYLQHRDTVFDSWVSQGLDVRRGRIRIVNNLKSDLASWSHEIVELLTYRAECALAAVILVSASARDRFLNNVVSVVESEFASLITMLREALDHLSPEAPLSVDLMLESLREQEAGMLRTIGSMHPRMAIYQAVSLLNQGNGSKEVIMGDKYDVHGQVGAVGPNAHVHDVQFNQVWNDLRDQVDLGKLSDELASLRGAMLEKATTPEEHIQIGMVASAEIEARKGNGPQAFGFLSKAGKWTLDVATAIGAGLAVEVLKRTLGL